MMGLQLVRSPSVGSHGTAVIHGCAHERDGARTRVHVARAPDGRADVRCRNVQRCATDELVGPRHTKAGNRPIALDRHADPVAVNKSIPADARAGTTVGKYKLHEIVGRGGMGVVYRAEHVYIGKEVAVKILHDGYGGREESIKRFLREARAASLINHPNIVDVTDFGKSNDGTVFFVMELLHGEPLDARLARASAGSSCCARSPSSTRWRARSARRTPRGSCTAISSPRT